jgi:hypothetical protein
MDESATLPIEQAVELVKEKVGLDPLMQQEVIHRVVGAFPMKFSQLAPASRCGVPGLWEQLELSRSPDPSRNDARVHGRAHGVVHINGQDFPVLVVPIKFDETVWHQLSYDAQCVARFLRSRKPNPDHDLHIIVVTSVPAEDPIVPRMWKVRAMRFK